MNLNWFTNILVQRPYFVLSAVAVISGTCIIIPFSLKSVSVPSFEDPQLGFSTRRTTIANRVTTWSNLVKSTRASGEFTTNPKEFLELKSKTELLAPTVKKTRKLLKKGKVRKNKKGKPVYGNITRVEGKENTKAIDKERWDQIANLNPNDDSLKTDHFFCGNPDERYAHMVIISKRNSDLFTLGSLLEMCRIEEQLMLLPYYAELCIQNTHRNNRCCTPWSLPNYVAILNRKESCSDITERDVDNTKSILLECAPYFHNLELDVECLKTKPNCGAPLVCFKHDAVHNILSYLTSTSFLPYNKSHNEWTELKETMLFLPLACSTTILPYYHQLRKINLEFVETKIVAMDFGVKNAVFDEYLISDAWWMGFGSLFVFICIWLYTKSFFLTMMTVTVIFLSLGISYFMYVLVFEIKFFPFMNLLAAVVAIGIGSDDAFIFCKIWEKTKNGNEDATLASLMSETFQHAFTSMFVTAITTSVAFLGSYVSSITAVCCFSIFAGIAVVANYFLMMTWFPACLIIWERSCLSNNALGMACMMVCWQRWCCIRSQFNLSSSWFRWAFMQRLWNAKETWLLDAVIKLKYFWFASLLSLTIVSCFVVMVYPGLQLPDSHEFQMFTISHPFEQYDFIYKNHFWFRSSAKMEQQMEYKMPLRFVWGVLPIDNGDYLDPSNLGTLTVDPTFDVSLPESQEWLKNFCQKLREQPFYEPTLGPLLPNCFIETFMESMERKCIDPFLKTDVTPCCEVSKFPFTKSVFDQCIYDEIADIYKTPSDYLSSGMAGPKFSKDQKPTIKAVIIEYDSSYSYTMSYEKMDEFFNTVEAWMTEQLQTAPATMKNGWFVSELEFYDLQRELNYSTKITILMSMVLAFIVLFFSTLNIFISLYAIITITGCIFATMATLVLMGWKLNILESTAISTAIGLTVDFSLHYSVNYCLCPEDLAGCRVAATRYALSYMVGPSFMAALTTGAAGAFMLPSLIMPYIQIGVFLVLVMAISWVYATFYLGSTLAIMGPVNNYGQLNFSRLMRCIRRRRNRPAQERPQPTVATVQDCHELEALTFPDPPISRDHPTPKPAKRRSANRKQTFNDTSPSGASAITIVLADDNGVNE